jgi:glycosyltransferase involved in cell wall biosynthesis
MKNKILLFIPCFNCCKQISRVIDNFNSNNMRYINEIIFIDNGSIDETLKNIKLSISNKKKFFNLPKTSLITNNMNYSLGGSHKVAFNYAKKNNFDYVIVLHGDDQADINDLSHILETKSYINYDCILGSRFMADSRLHGYSYIRILGNIIFNTIFSLVARYKICDLGSGLNIFSKEIYLNNDHLYAEDSLLFNIFLLLKIIKNNRKINFVPISWTEEDQVSNARLFSMFFKILHIVIKSKFNNNFYNKKYGKFSRINSYKYKRYIL